MAQAMARVAIWGCCATRDLFSARPSRFEVVAYQARTGFLSQVAPPVPGAGTLFAGAPPTWEHRMSVADVAKTTVAALVAACPAILVLDLVTDVRCQLIERGGFVVCEYHAGFKRPLLAAAAGEAPERTVRRDDPARPARFAAAAATIMPGLRAALPETAFVIHAVRGIRALNGPDPTGLGGLALSERAVFDERIAAAEEVLAAAIPGVSLLNSVAEERVGAVDHPFGPLVVHYDAGYYAAMLARLEAISGLAP